MKKLLIFLMAILAPIAGYGQDVTRTFTFTSSTSGPCIPLANTGVQYHVIRWRTDTTVSAGTIKLEKTSAAACSSGFSDVIPAISWTSDGTSAVVNNSANFVRMTSASYAGSGNVVVTYMGYRFDPTSQFYTEGDVDTTITGMALLFEGASNTLVAAPGTAADGLLVNVSNV